MKKLFIYLTLSIALLACTSNKECHDYNVEVTYFDNTTETILFKEQYGEPRIEFSIKVAGCIKHEYYAPFRCNVKKFEVTKKL